MKGARFGTVVFACMGAFLVVTSGAGAEDRTWRGDLSNDGTYLFSDAANWTPEGGFQAGDRGFFLGSDTYGIPEDSVFTVVMTADVSAEHLRWLNGQFEMTLDLDGNTLTTSDRPIIRGDGSGILVTLTGGAATFDTLAISENSGTVGNLHLQGAGTSLDVDGSGGATSVGAAGTGSFRLSDGAQFTSRRMTVLAGSSGGTGDGTLHLSSGSSVEATNHIWIGDYGNGSLTVEGGSTVTQTGNLMLTFGVRGGSGQVATGLITGEGSLLRAAGVTSWGRGITIGGLDGDRVGDDILKSAGSAHVTVADRARMESNMMVLIWDVGKLTVDNGTVKAGSNLWARTGSEIELVMHNANRDALIQVGEDVMLEDSDVTLSLALGAGASFAYGEFVELIQFGGQVDGVFSNYAESDEFTLGDFEFRFTYAGGSENDTIGLEVIPEPGALAMVLLGLGAMLLRRRH